MDFTKFLIRISLVLIIPIIAAITTFTFVKSYLFEATAPGDTSTILVEIPADASSEVIGQKLVDHKLLKAPWVLGLLAALRSDAASIKAGEYELQRSMTPRQVLAKLSSGQIFKRDITITAGETIWQVAEAFEKAGIVSKDEFLNACTDQQLLIRAGIKAESFEGYLYPGDYKFSRADSVARYIWRMLEEGEHVWKTEYTDRAEELKLTRHEVLTFASLLMAESGNPMEMPSIAGVYHNRLMNLMKLQSEASVRYGLKDPTITLTEAELEDATNPYNTFAHYGLPPGPINNPNEEAIKAVLSFQEHQYLFFIKDPSGGHQFAETLKDYTQLKSKLEKSR